MHMVIGYEPCAKCKENWAKGFTLLEMTKVPNSRTDVPMQDGVYPTGRFAVIRMEAARRIFKEAVNYDKAFVTPGDFVSILGESSA